MNTFQKERRKFKREKMKKTKNWYNLIFYIFKKNLYTIEIIMQLIIL